MGPSATPLWKVTVPHFPGHGIGFEGKKATRLEQTWLFLGFFHLELKGQGDETHGTGVAGGPLPYHMEKTYLQPVKRNKERPENRTDRWCKALQLWRPDSIPDTSGAAMIPARHALRL